ncbi:MULTISPECIES: RHS repeat-associated core domain-containing protein [unclassified Frankia]|uniref:RHS repeat-associated core domain-containing protein n=1 Tax=unclassified Frankia TaxID=2632575 RepID=UPI001F461810|nr:MULTISPECIES: RHS repeat-associated core domain-containing protein [unclassified Frankia]
MPYATSTAYPRYGWLGAKQRSHDTLAGLTLMGVRLYNPYTARFLSTDPVLGGSANPYDYTNQDPYNTFDLDGRWFWSKWSGWRRAETIALGVTLGVAIFTPSPLNIGFAIFGLASYYHYYLVRRDIRGRYCNYSYVNQCYRM